MKSLFIKKEIAYDGTQLSSHWILKQTRIFGDAVVSFQGPCRVDLDGMVDLEDVLQKKPIFSESMLHFIVEHFGADLEKMILRQRLLMSGMHQILRNLAPDSPVRREGDDLFEGDKKLSVSIATVSPVSSLIHAGINISSRNTPLPTKGLNDFQLNPEEFAGHVMRSYVKEMEGVSKARVKVLGVK